MSKIINWIKSNKVLVIMGGVLILGGVTTAILTTTLPSYQVTKVLITNAPEALTGEVKQSGASSNPIEFIIEGKSKNGGKAPSPSFSITMTGTDDSNPPKWLSISNNLITWGATEEKDVGVYTFIISISAGGKESIYQHTVELSIEHQI